MKSYSDEGVFYPWVIESFRKAQRIVEVMMDPPGVELRCHEVARVVLELLDDPRWSVVDGRYGMPHVGPRIDHTYLTTSRGAVAGYVAVLDPYAIARLPQVQLVSGEMALASMYLADRPRDDINHDLITILVEQCRQYIDPPTCGACGQDIPGWHERSYTCHAGGYSTCFPRGADA